MVLLKNRKEKQTKQATRLVTGSITWAQSVCGHLAPRLPPHTHGEPTLPFSPTNIEFFHLHCDGETEAEFAKCDSFSSAFSFLRKFQTHAFPAHAHLPCSRTPPLLTRTSPAHARLHCSRAPSLLTRAFPAHTPLPCSHTLLLLTRTFTCSHTLSLLIFPSLGCLSVHEPA